MTHTLARRASAEFLGTAVLVATVVGSGIMGSLLSDDLAVTLLINALATVAALGVLIWAFGPISGAHFNPLVSIADWGLGRRRGTGLPARDVGAYIVAQVAGAICGAILANAMFEAGTHISGNHRAGSGRLLGEVVATAGLILLIFALARTERGPIAAPAIGAYIGAAYWFTSSTSFANPAVTVGRIFTDTFAGIAPNAAAAFIGMQVIGAIVGVGLLLVLYPDAGRAADDVVFPRARDEARA